VNNLIRSLGGFYKKWNKIFYLLVNLMFGAIPYEIKYNLEKNGHLYQLHHLVSRHLPQKLAY
jgi:hypothetical protein